MKSNKVIIIIVILLLVAGLGFGAWYFFFKKPAAATTTSNSSGSTSPSQAPPTSSGSLPAGTQTVGGFPVAGPPILNVTYSQVKAKNWQNRAGASGLGTYITGYDNSTHTVYHQDIGWVGTLTDANTIQWKKNKGGVIGALGVANYETDTWTAV